MTFIPYELSLLAIIFGGLAFAGSIGASWLSIKIASRLNITDDPASNPLRKRQTHPIPLLGATGFIFVCTGIISFIWLIRKLDVFNFGNLLGLNLEPFKIIWILVAIFILVCGGILDDKFHLSSKWMLIPVNLALIVTVFFGGLKITAFSYPFNEILPDNQLLNYLFCYIWIGFCLTATKFLDGHDGLVSTVGIIGLLTVASVSLFPNVNQPLIFLFSVVWACGIAGFLPFNFPNAKVYLGEGGSEIIGYMVGVLSVISGAKIATAGTVIGWFIYDILFVILLRILQKKNPFLGDRNHWHFRLVDLGLSKLQVLGITTTILLITAFSGLVLGTEYKAYLLAGQGVFLLIVFSITYLVSKVKSNANPNKTIQKD